MMMGEDFVETHFEPMFHYQKKENEMKKIELLKRKERQFLQKRGQNIIPDKDQLVLKLVVLLLENGVINDEDVDYLENR